MEEERERRAPAQPVSSRGSLVAPTQRAAKGGKATSRGTLLGMDDDEEEEEEQQQQQHAVQSRQRPGGTSQGRQQQQRQGKLLQEDDEEEEEDDEDLVLSARDVEQLLGDQGASGAGQEGELDDWGLEEIKDSSSQVRTRVWE